MSTIVVSDTHLGYANSQHAVFDKFLSSLLEKDDIENLIILGDFIDMWRRDISGIFLDFHHILEKILMLQEKTNLFCVVGNHDYHMLQLTAESNKLSSEYPLKFLQDKYLTIDGIMYHFMHGYEFDKLQQVPLMEILCYTLSDGAGELKTDFWSKLTSLGADLKFLETFFRLHKGDIESALWNTIKSKGSLSFKDMENMMKPPQERDIQVSTVELGALAQQQKEPDVKLVFGHTHVPFVTSDNMLANSGSWLSNELTYSTFIEIKEGITHLYRIYPDMPNITEITEKFTRKAGT